MSVSGMGIMQRSYKTVRYNNRRRIDNYRRCVHLVKGKKGTMAAALLFSLFSVLCNTVSAVTLKLVVDDAIPNGSIRFLWMLQFVFLVCVLLDTLCGVLSKRFSYALAAHAQNCIRERLFDSLLHADYLSLQEESMSELITTITYGVDNLEGGLSRCVTVTIGNILSILIILSVMLSLSPQMTCLAVLVFPVLIALSSHLGKWIDRTNREMQAGRTQLTRDVEEGLACLIGIRSNGLNDYMTKRFHNNVQKVGKTNIQRNTVFEIMNRASWTLVIVPYQSILYGVGGTMAILYGAPTIGTLLIFANFTNSLIQPVMGLVQLVSDMALAADSFTRIDSILNIQKQRPQIYDCPAEKGHYLEMEELVYRYPDQDDLVIDGLSAAFSFGETAILWGRSGSGKSTLLKLIDGLLPCPNTTCIRKDIQKRWGYFPQNPTLFDMTLRENFRLVRNEINDQSMWSLLNAVGMAQSVQAKGYGLDCPVSRNDCLFSVGEYRRLCLAVFFASEMDVMLFDEPTASLDRESAECIAAVLRRMASEKKSLIIATHDQNLRTIGVKEIEMRKRR